MTHTYEMKKSWRFSKRALFVHSIAWCLGISNHVVTRVSRMPDDPHFPGECCRSVPHDGPCNGFPAPTCKGYVQWIQYCDHNGFGEPGHLTAEALEAEPHEMRGISSGENI